MRVGLLCEASLRRRDFSRANVLTARKRRLFLPAAIPGEKPLSALPSTTPARHVIGVGGKSDQLIQMQSRSMEMEERDGEKNEAFGR